MKCVCAGSASGLPGQCQGRQIMRVCVAPSGWMDLIQVRIMVAWAHHECQNFSVDITLLCLEDEMPVRENDLLRARDDLMKEAGVGSRSGGMTEKWYGQPNGSVCFVVALCFACKQGRRRAQESVWFVQILKCTQNIIFLLYGTGPQNHEITSIIGSFEDSKVGSDSAFPAPSWRRGKSSKQSTRAGAGNPDSVPHEVRLERDVGMSLLLNVCTHLDLLGWLSSQASSGRRKKHSHRHTHQHMHMYRNKKKTSSTAPWSGSSIKLIIWMNNLIETAKVVCSRRCVTQK